MSSALGCDHLALVQPMMRVINGWTAMFWGGCGAGCDRAARDSHTWDGCLPDGSAIERFSVSDPLKRLMQTEAGGWRHFVFWMADCGTDRGLFDRAWHRMQPDQAG